MTTETIRISTPRMARAIFHIRGTAPLMTARFSKKAELQRKMEEGKSAGSRKDRSARDFEADAIAATYFSPEGWRGIHAPSFRNAAISACRLVAFKMTLAKLSIFVEADGYDKEEGVPLVRIYADDPSTSIMNVRNATGVVDLRARPMWTPGWEAKPCIRWDQDQFSLTDITNLMGRVGMQVGVGEGRPDSRESNGLGYGLFEIVTVDVLR